eukprot:Em0005g61a
MERELFGDSSAEDDSSSDESSAQEASLEHVKPAVDDKSSSDSNNEESGNDVKVSAETHSVSQPSQFPSTQDLFGDSGSESSPGEQEGGVGHLRPEVGSPAATPIADQEDTELSPFAPSKAHANAESSRTVEGIFGDAGDLTSSEDEKDAEGPGNEEGAESQPLRAGQDVEEEVPRINVEIPRCVAQLGSELYFAKLPNFLSVETRPFDPNLYEDEGEEDDILDEEGRARLKLKVENTIRWRSTTDENGDIVRESNTRIVRWSDGSMSLHLGSEIFDIYKQPLQGEHSHLFVRQGTGLQGQAVFKSKINFRPHSTDSQTHRKMTLSIADRFSKAQKIRVLSVVGKDPESERFEKIKKEEDNLRAAVRKESHQKRAREKHSQRGLTASYLEPDNFVDDEDDEESLSAIKSSVRSKLGRGRESYGSDESGEEERVERLMKAKGGEPAEREVPAAKKKKRRALSDDDEEEED